MGNGIFVRASLGILVVLAGIVALLGGIRVVAVDWHVAGPLLVTGFGFWIVLCALECHRTELLNNSQVLKLPFL